jgi:uncharacterized protein YqgC (DUF456 family)
MLLNILQQAPSQELGTDLVEAALWAARNMGSDRELQRGLLAGGVLELIVQLWIQQQTEPLLHPALCSAVFGLIEGNETARIRAGELGICELVSAHRAKLYVVVLQI